MGETRKSRTKGRATLKVKQKTDELEVNEGPTDLPQVEKLSLIGCPSAESSAQSSEHSKSGSVSLTSTLEPWTALSPNNNYQDSNTAVPAPSPQDDLIEVQKTSDRGLAVFALRKIKAGTLILAERPLITLFKVEEDDYDTIKREYARLSPSNQHAYLKLFDSEKSRMSRVVSIYYSNCYNIENFIETGGSAIGALASRINHSCIPNAQFSYHEPSGQMRFFAIRDISRGKEVLGNYDKVVFETAAKRQGKQMMYYRFSCKCEACVPLSEFWVRSDERRIAMFDAVKTVQGCEKKFAGFAETGSSKDVEKDEIVCDALKALTRLEGLLLKEALVSVPLANCYRSLAKWAERQEGNRDLVMKWKMQELEACILGFGKDAQRTKAIAARLRELQANDT